MSMRTADNADTVSPGRRWKSGFSPAGSNDASTRTLKPASRTPTSPPAAAITPVSTRSCRRSRPRPAPTACTAPGGIAGQQEVDYVRACNQQDEADGREEDPPCLACRSFRTHFRKGTGIRAPSLVVVVLRMRAVHLRSGHSRGGHGLPNTYAWLSLRDGEPVVTEADSELRGNVRRTSTDKASGRSTSGWRVNLERFGHCASEMTTRPTGLPPKHRPHGRHSNESLRRGDPTFPPGS